MRIGRILKRISDAPIQSIYRHSKGVRKRERERDKQKRVIQKKNTHPDNS